MDRRFQPNSAIFGVASQLMLFDKAKTLRLQQLLAMF